MCGHYRNMYIKVLIEAPIIIVPIHNKLNTPLKSYQKTVIAVHLGAISVNEKYSTFHFIFFFWLQIDSNVTEFPSHHDVQEEHDRNIQVTSLQRFRVQLNELFLKYIESEDKEEDVTGKSGELVISPFAVQVITWKTSMAVIPIAGCDSFDFDFHNA
jgi:hypothetical protein